MSLKHIKYILRPIVDLAVIINSGLMDFDLCTFNRRLTLKQQKYCLKKLCSPLLKNDNTEKIY